MSTDEKTREFTVIVNGRPKKIETSEITFEQAIALAFDDPPRGEFIVFTVSWRHGNEAGSLTEGDTLEVRNGMKLDVTATDKS